MSKSIQILKNNTVELPDISSYKLTIQAINPQDMPSKIFINQRVRNFAKSTFDDTFVAVCTPTQLEDLQEDAPDEGTSYYRTDKIELIARTPEVIQTILDSLLYEVKKLVVDLSDLDNLAEPRVYTISADSPIV